MINYNYLNLNSRKHEELKFLEKKPAVDTDGSFWKISTHDFIAQNINLPGRDDIQRIHLLLEMSELRPEVATGLD